MATTRKPQGILQSLAQFIFGTKPNKNDDEFLAANFLTKEEADKLLAELNSETFIISESAKLKSEQAKDYIENRYGVNGSQSHENSYQKQKTISMTESQKINALLLACSTGDLDLVQELLADNNALAITRPHGNTPLHLAVINHHPKVAQFIKNKFADSKISTEILSAPNAFAQSPVDIAQQSDNKAIREVFGLGANTLKHNGRN